MMLLYCSHVKALTVTLIESRNDDHHRHQVDRLFHYL